jgi:hypothetical protein
MFALLYGTVMSKALSKACGDSAHAFEKIKNPQPYAVVEARGVDT